MAAAQQMNRRKEVEFPPNLPITVALAYAEPKRFNGRDGDRMMFTTTANEIMFLSPEVAGTITELGINVGVQFTITRKSSGKKGDADTWEVARLAGEQGDGTFAAPKLPEATPGKPMARAATATGGALVDAANALIDDYAAVLNRALTKHEGRVKPDEVRAIFLTAAINFAQKGRAA